MYAAVRSSGSSVEGTHNNAEERIYHSYHRVQIHSYINEGLFAQEAGRPARWGNIRMRLVSHRSWRVMFPPVTCAILPYHRRCSYLVVLIGQHNPDVLSCLVLIDLGNSGRCDVRI